MATQSKPKKKTQAEDKKVSVPRIVVPLVDLAVRTVDDQFEDVFLLADKGEATTKTNKPYFTFTLKNPTGKVTGKVWSWAQHAAVYSLMRPIPVGSIVKVAGRFIPGFPEGAEPEAEMVDIEIIHEPDHPYRNLLNDVCPIPLDRLVAEFDRVIEGIGNPGLRRFAELLFDDPDGCPRDKFFYAPAAMRHHHNYISGLLEHTLEVVHIAKGIAAQPMIARKVHLDVLLVGLLAHDIGKTKEYQWEGVPIGMSHAGRLSDHMVTGPEMVRCVWAKHRDEVEPLGMTEKHLDVIVHIICSHHGKPEWGAVKEPACVEAIIAHHADNTSAQVRGMIAAIDSSTPDDSGWIMGHRSFYRGLFTLPPDPLAFSPTYAWLQEGG